MRQAATRHLLLALRFALGVTECLFLPAAIALIAEYHGPGSRARALSLISIGVNTGMVLGGSFAGYMAQHYGWRTGFWALGIGGIVLVGLGGGAGLQLARRWRAGRRKDGDQ